jgi:hypothetical protein
MTIIKILNEAGSGVNRKKEGKVRLQSRPAFQLLYEGDQPVNVGEPTKNKKGSINGIYGERTKRGYRMQNSKARKG